MSLLKLQLVLLQNLVQHLVGAYLVRSVQQPLRQGLLVGCNLDGMLLQPGTEAQGLASVAVHERITGAEHAVLA